MNKQKIPEIIYYSMGCPVCDDLFRDLFMFCVQNTIPYEVKRHVKDLSEPAMRWGDEWFTGENMVDRFKEQWRAKNVV